MGHEQTMITTKRLSDLDRIKKLEKERMRLEARLDQNRAAQSEELEQHYAELRKSGKGDAAALKEEAA